MLVSGRDETKSVAAKVNASESLVITISPSQIEICRTMNPIHFTARVSRAGWLTAKCVKDDIAETGKNAFAFLAKTSASSAARFLMMTFLRRLR